MLVDKYEGDEDLNILRDRGPVCTEAKFRNIQAQRNFVILARRKGEKLMILCSRTFLAGDR
jgi:hypothetical protein